MIIIVLPAFVGLVLRIYYWFCICFNFLLGFDGENGG